MVTIDAELDLSLSDDGDPLSARLNVSLPGVERELAQALVDEAHEICPYSKETRGNIDVVIKLVEPATSRANCCSSLEHRPQEHTMPFTINVNGRQHVDVDGDTPLLWVLRDMLGMTGTKFGCGMALCGACTVHIDGAPTRSCITPLDCIGERESRRSRRSADSGGRHGPEGVARSGRAPVRLLPVRPDHDGGGAARRANRDRPMPTSTTR